jgi:putative tricarboxylic transport membrane protein
MRTLATLVAGTAAVILAMPVQAQDFKPSRPECIAPAQPGGGFDLTCRIAVNSFEEAKLLERPMSVSFMPGGVGAVAYQHMNTQRADDPDVIVAFSGGSLLNIAQGKFGQDLDENNARWLASAGADFGVITVKADSPYDSLQALGEALAAEPQSLVFGAGGTVGSQDWMKAALFVQSAGVDPRAIRYVAFEGGGESIAALLGDSIQIYTGDAAEMKGRIDDGTLKILAVLSEERLPEPFAEIPTAKEQGFDIEWTIIRGYYMGKDVSDEAYDWWVAKFEELYATPEFTEVQSNQGLFPYDSAGPEFAEDVKTRVGAYRELARAAGLIE